ncbi:GNAT family N-acetyltransferase [Serratia proteamaculans]|uniref:GNAT family N-acetyltransferase n=1 Tax=Serratia proteamaculans TaxID=28151 RepID=UPI002980E92D|nr:GNAT family N-acetyltransferase [Serratia proteamaculans]MDW5499275.1 GNAT family N-acetyltransferase [Serratia proteamaculans]
MIRKLTSFASGWRHATANEYKLCHQLYGGSFMTHPDVLQFFQARLDCQPAYYVKRTYDDRPIGAFCSWGGKDLALTGNMSKKIGIERYTFNRDELILPLSPDLKTTIPFKTKKLSSLNGNNTRNATFKLNSHRAICLAKGCGQGGFSSSTKNSRRRELNRFLNAGGEIVEQTQFTPEQLAAIYFELYEKRWGNRPGHYEEMVDMLSSLRSMFFGHVLFFDGKPCAFQLITKAESPDWICFDYVNGGYDQLHENFCPGTIVTWLNVKAAYDLCASQDKAMRYSFGKPTADYKDRWCYRSPLGRVLTI